ncbi:hypothetical protein TKK_0010182 [Trichogramma kaykai]|uniref:BEN domain-containing protein n=1 Tax=Trichogramma kaykai TaxID=54128 RepID=A0ABD2WZ32_9HYME
MIKQNVAVPTSSGLNKSEKNESSTFNYGSLASGSTYQSSENIGDPIKNIPTIHSNVQQLSEELGLPKKNPRKKSKRSLKKKKKGKYKIKPEEKLYDSDDYQKSGLPILQHQSYFEEIDEKTGKTIKMRHLYYGVSITAKLWKKANNSPTDSRFVKEIAVGIWGKDTLKIKALKPQQAAPLPDGNRRAPLTPRKEAALKKCYLGRLKLEKRDLTGMTKVQIKSLRNKYRTFLSKYINRMKSATSEDVEDDEKDSDEDTDEGSDEGEENETDGERESNDQNN